MSIRHNVLGLQYFSAVGNNWRRFCRQLSFFFLLNIIPPKWQTGIECYNWVIRWITSNVSCKRNFFLWFLSLPLWFLAGIILFYFFKSWLPEKERDVSRIDIIKSSFMWLMYNPFLLSLGKMKECKRCLDRLWGKFGVELLEFFMGS